MSAANTLIVKLKDETPSTKGPDLIREILGKRAVEGVEPLMPGADEPDLATLYNVTLGPSASAPRAIAALEKNPQVQYAHTPKGRSPK